MWFRLCKSSFFFRLVCLIRFGRYGTVFPLALISSCKSAVETVKRRQTGRLYDRDLIDFEVDERFNQSADLLNAPIQPLRFTIPRARGQNQSDGCFTNLQRKPF